MRVWPQALLMGAMRAYRFFLSPWLGSACRFEPTCSAYALDALGRYGAGRGLALTVGRVGRCHPWCAGGVDPVPAQAPSYFTALLGRAPRAPKTCSPSESTS